MSAIENLEGYFSGRATIRLVWQLMKDTFERRVGLSGMLQDSRVRQPRARMDEAVKMSNT